MLQLLLRIQWRNDYFMILQDGYLVIHLTHRELPFSWSTGGYGGDWENKDLQSKNIHFYFVFIYDIWLILLNFFV